MDNESDYAALHLRGKSYYIGDTVSYGSSSATRSWVGRIERFFEDYRGKWVGLLLAVYRKSLMSFRSPCDSSSDQRTCRRILLQIHCQINYILVTKPATIQLRRLSAATWSTANHSTSWLAYFPTHYDQSISSLYPSISFLISQ